MKNTVLTLSLAALLTLAPESFPNTAAAAADKSGYLYTIIDNRATVTGFTGDPVFIEIPETVEGCRITEIRDNAFYECGSLRHITIPDTVEKIGHHSFYACYSLESIVLPDSIREIGMGCFCGCEALTSVSLPDTLERLPESCFRSCTSLRSVTVPEEAQEIGDFCFSGCTSLTAVSLGDKLTSIGDCAFYMCDSLTGLYIPPSAADIGFCAVGYIPTESGAAPLDGFTLLGLKKSAAEKYAADNSLTFENAADSVHAFAIQRISGRRVAVPSVFVVLGILLIICAFLALLRRKNRKK